ncbi:MAG: LamB/YcsF family protein [Mycobacterium sp.]|nr:LamB/YcsF family protein [Mycobacterium sp.]
MSIDLNADLGEGFGLWRMADDDALLDIVTSANVACGFHAGDPPTMRRVCSRAAARDVRIGAHVSYRDLAGFGRRFLAVDPDELRDEITYQIAALDGMARAAGTQVSYVKAHGALYNRVADDPHHAAALIEGTRSFDPSLPLLGLPGSVLLQLAADAGTLTIAEGFPDRRYTNAGRLAPRTEPDSVLSDPEEVSSNAVRLAESGEVASLCLHGDNPAAVELARATRSALLAAGSEIVAFA